MFEVVREADLLVRVREVADSEVGLRDGRYTRLGLLFTKSQKMLFLSLTYWRDIQARL